MAQRRKLSLDKREQQNLANWMGSINAQLRIAKDNEDWEAVQKVYEQINQQACDINCRLLGVE